MLAVETAIAGGWTWHRFSESVKISHKIEIPYKIQSVIELSTKFITFGDPLRRRRLGLGLFQKKCRCSA